MLDDLSIAERTVPDFRSVESVYWIRTVPDLVSLRIRR